MAKISARNASIILAAEGGTSTSPISGKSNRVSLNITRSGLDVMPFGQSYRNRISGMAAWSLDIEGYYDLAAGGTACALDAANGGSIVFIFGPSGSAGGATKYSGSGVLQDVQYTFATNAVAGFTAKIVPFSGILTRGTF